MLRFHNLFYCAIILSLVISAKTVCAQNAPPSDQFGVGIYNDFSYLPAGFEITYAADSTLQFGSDLSLSISNSVASYHIAPYVRYLYPTVVSLFAQAGIQLYSPSTGTQFGFFLGGGVAYTIKHQLNIHGDVDILNFFFSPGTTKWLMFRIGGDWFF